MIPIRYNSRDTALSTTFSYLSDDPDQVQQQGHSIVYELALEKW